MAQNDMQEFYMETADVLSKEHAEAAAEIRQGAIVLQESIAARATTEKRSSLLARLFNGNI